MIKWHLVRQVSSDRARIFYQRGGRGPNEFGRMTNSRVVTTIELWSNCFVIANIRTWILLAEVLSLILKKACIEDFLIFVINDTILAQSIRGASFLLGAPFPTYCSAPAVFSLMASEVGGDIVSCLGKKNKQKNPSSMLLVIVTYN